MTRFRKVVTTRHPGSRISLYCLTTHVTIVFDQALVRAVPFCFLLGGVIEAFMNTVQVGQETFCASLPMMRTHLHLS